MEPTTKGGPLPLAFRRTMVPLIEELIKPKSLKNDLFFALLLVLMKENDFVLVNQNNEQTVNIIDLITSIRCSELKRHEAVFNLNNFKGLHVKIISNFLDDIALINVTIPELCKETYSICLPTNLYVAISQLGIPTEFTNLESLSSVFIEKVANPIKCVILNYYNSPSANLSGLPEDVLHEIILKLPVSDILNLSAICKRIYYIIKEEGLWFRLFKRDFPKIVVVENNWKSLYKRIYRTEGIEKRVKTVDAEKSHEFIRYSDYQGSMAQWEMIL